MASMLAPPIPRSLNTWAAASKSRSRVASRVGRTRSLDMGLRIHHCIDSIHYCIEVTETVEEDAHDPDEPGRSVLRRRDVPGVSGGSLSSLRRVPRPAPAAARGRYDVAPPGACGRAPPPSSTQHVL